MPKMEINNNKAKIWRENGKLHRVRKPAVILPDGTVKYYINGEPHRKDGPAVIFPDGSESWWCHGKFHRVDGPSVNKIIDGVQIWHRHGVFHREDGPAFVMRGHSSGWYLYGKLIKEEHFQESHFWKEEK